MGLLGTLLGTTDMGSIMTSIDGLITTVSAVIYALAAFGLTLFAIYVGYKMVRAEDDGKRKEAKQQLIYSIVGLIGCVALITMFTLVLPTIANLTLDKTKITGTDNASKMAKETLDLINKIMGTLVKLITLGASVLAMFVGWKLMSAEDEGKRKQAKTQLIYAIVGIVGVVMINAIGTTALGMIPLK